MIKGGIPEDVTVNHKSKRCTKDGGKGVGQSVLDSRKNIFKVPEVARSLVLN